MPGKIWRITEYTQEAKQLASQLCISDLLGQLLINRGIMRLEEAAAFLTPELSQLHDPFLLSGMKPAVERVTQAIHNKERVLIYGDYDVDGITSIVLMVRALSRHFPGRLLYYAPKRVEEGYGLHLSSLEKALAQGVDLVITVDCGISTVNEASYLQSKGVDLIITDHHEPPAVLPTASAIINPKLPDSKYPFSHLAGVGVAYKFLQGLSTVFPDIGERLAELLDLVAFGTISDIVPLLDENRVLVKYGLEKLNHTSNLGLQALIQIAGLKDKSISTGQVGFILAPRVNAAGRMGNPVTAIKLFLAADPLQAQDLARELEKENQNRQEVENHVFQEASAMAAICAEDEPALVLSGGNWHLGVIGIVASKLVDLYHKPVILIGLDGENGRGSGRSISGFNLFQAVSDCETYLEKYGGHEFAAGLTIARERISEFKTAFLQLAKERLSREALQPVIKVESLIDLNQINLELARELNLLAPCGPCNPTPILGCKSVNLLDSKNVGENGKHLKLRVAGPKTVHEGIGFNLGFIHPELTIAKAVDIAFSVEENHWNGSTQVQLNLKDIVCHGGTTQ